MTKRKQRVRKVLLCRKCQSPVEQHRLDCYCLPCRAALRDAAAPDADSDAWNEAVRAIECPEGGEVV